MSCNPEALKTDDPVEVKVWLWLKDKRDLSRIPCVGSGIHTGAQCPLCAQTKMIRSHFHTKVPKSDGLKVKTSVHTSRTIAILFIIIIIAARGEILSTSVRFWES